jgi:ankyrin repeat protein
MNFDKFKNESLLLISCSSGNIEQVKKLLSEGADVHAYDDQALINASYYGHLEIVKLLVEHGANIHAQNDESLNMTRYKKHLEIVSYLEKQILIENISEIN